MILAATNADTGAFTFTYALSVLGFVGCAAAFCAISVWLIDQWATRGIRRKVNAARAQLDAPATPRHRHTVPKQLTDERTPR